MFSRFRSAAAVAIVTGVICSWAGAQDTPARRTIGQIGWLSGAWEGTAGPVSFEERWTPPAGGAMLGVARTIEDGRMVAFEFLRIIERDDTLVYIAQPDGRPPTEFTLSDLDRDSATFENPAHDFPKRIRYARGTGDTLEAQISGDPPRKPQTFLFRRVQSSAIP